MNSVRSSSCMFHNRSKTAWGRLFVRLALAVVFIVHGWWKLADMDATIAFMTMLGVPLPGVTAWVVALVELLGGIAMLVGFYVCIAGILLALDMLVALYLVHAANGFSVAKNGYEFVFVLALVSLGVALLGPGKWSLGQGKYCCTGKSSGCCGKCGSGEESQDFSSETTA